MKNGLKWYFRFLVLVACAAMLSTASKAQQGVSEDLAHCTISVLCWVGDPVWPTFTRSWRMRHSESPACPFYSWRSASTGSSLAATAAG
jgi:hypothetical protein